MGACCSSGGSGGLSRRGGYVRLTPLGMDWPPSGLLTRYRESVCPVSMDRGNELQQPTTPAQVPNAPDLLTSQSQFELDGQDPTPLLLLFFCSCVGFGRPRGASMNVGCSNFQTGFLPSQSRNSARPGPDWSVRACPDYIMPEAREEMTREELEQGK